ncbi:A24 family peptidase [Moraxella sp. VT-16-12]|uniref:prepilin peptidase n=1 Tax=Moraxella sp. VT-16-12 TaxID=2014877 RepID=UPI000B7FB9ED|nr:A24 family peptidase [Moraxella sp. VT-16-12]TWV84102.1 prepilin peptidase [Moraxella sp. VT-16-12]
MDILTSLSQNMPLALILAGVFGLCVGSFLNVVIHRTPLIMKRQWRQECAEFLSNEPDIHPKVKEYLSDTIAKDTPVSLSFPPSRCPNCHHQIRAYENIPLISWLILLRGKCSRCGTSISIRYPLVELISALLSVLMIYSFGATFTGLMALIYLWMLIALTGIDFDTQLLPDRLVFPLGMIGLAVNTQNTFTSLTSAVWGGLLGFLSLWSVATLYGMITKKEGMGAGDFKLLGAIGAWLGASMLPLIILLSALLGSVVGLILIKKSGESKPFAFGPYIAIAGIVALLWGQDIMSWYLTLYQ